MVDEIAPTVIAPASVVEVAPVVAPVVETPVVAPAPVAPVIETTSAITKPEPTVLGETPQVEPTVESPAPVVEEPKDEKAQSDEPAPAPVFEKFNVPETVQLDDGLVKEFTDILSDLEVKSKAEHTLVQEFGQKAVDFHLKEVQKAQENLIKHYQKEWDNQKITWKDDFLKDPDIGGNRFQTTINAALSFIRTHGGTPEQQTELRLLMDSSGLGNNKTIIRLFANAGRAMSEGKPLSAPAPLPQPKTKTETMYGSRK